MIQGTASNAGKSTLVAGLCRVFQRRGLHVRPFKPQNMSNNAAVTADGGEIGRAQALQARACKIATSVHMNPVLLKPQTDIGAQVVVQGRVLGNYSASAYGGLKATLLPKVMQSLEICRADADLVLIEGAGSPAEVNLRAGDIANMGLACAAQIPVILAGDIDRGGVIAALVGTWHLLTEVERSLLKGYVINKFRGDPRLFESALPIINAHTGLRSFGTVTWFDRARDLPEEDVLGLDQAGLAQTDRVIRIAVPRLPRIANYDDLDPLLAEPDVALTIVQAGQALPGDANLIILPGSKATLSDLRALRETGWDIDLQAHIRRGGHVLGICGGFQMLGRTLHDPDGIEGPPESVDGLGVLDIDTVLTNDKRLVEVEGQDRCSGKPIHGFEMHVGRTTGPALSRPMLDVSGRFEGAISADSRIMGCYIHGLFAADEFRHAFLNTLRERPASNIAFEARVDEALDALADHLEACLDTDSLLAIAEAGA
ncbi:MAG: cobyric acid synthase [Geminicoccaceae bacterium]